MSNIPATREEAIAALVESDVAKWGEEEREASRQMHSGKTYGLALNELASRAELAGAADKALRAAAKAALTKADWAWLRRGG